MSGKKSNKKNNISKSIKYIFRQAKSGSKLHIGIIAVALAALMLPIFMVACGGNNDIVDEYVENELDQSYDKDQEALDVEQLGNTILMETEDAGQEYIDNTLFIGDSNTVRTQVYGHTTWNNVVAAVSMGVQHIPNLKMTYFKGYKEAVTVPEAVKIIQPQRIIITYGTNNTLGFTVEDFIKMYKDGLNAIKKAYPYAEIIINSIPPVDKERENTAITMQTIDKMNKALSEMAKEEGYKFINSAEALKDEKTGFAKKDYTIGDGVHLSKLGMDAMFEYFRTHAYITEDKRPKPLKKVPEREETPTGVISEDPIAVRGTRIRIVFQSSDVNLGRVEGEVEQKIKRTITSQPVRAVPVTENGGVFTGWSCNVEGLSSTSEDSVTFTVPKVDENVTEIVITANFAKVGLGIKADGNLTKSIKLDKGQSKQLTADITAAFRGDRTVTWTSEDSSIAKVDENGNVTAVNGGKTQIIASILGNKIYTVCDVVVNQPLEGISISGDSAVMVGGTVQLKAELKPAGASADVNNTVWSSSDESVATVVAGGKVTAKKEGTAVITATLDGFTAQHTVNVTRPKPLESISLSGTTELFEGEKTQLTVAYNPADTTESKAAKWSSSDTSVATVSEGAVVANSAGTAEITCTVGNCTAKITIVVKQEPNYVKSVSLSNGEITLTPGGTATLTATPVLAFPDRPEGVDTTASWSSANGYVSVSGGTVTVRSDLTSPSGTLTDTVTVTVGGRSATCVVVITDVPVPVIKCASCGGEGHTAENHCSWCNAVNCTATHCPECGSTEHTQHPQPIPEQPADPAPVPETTE
ncbi:MAG: Ig-like domain-containing protein [Oscillospiraceae bacterium]|nr:Ig-like domain-containing protein [Oscillospiraceae bacterium]